MGLPGLPSQTDLAYLAGLIDGCGTFACAEKSSTIGLKISAPPRLRNWLVLRFGGYDTARAWWLTRQADLRYVVTGVAPYLVRKRAPAQTFLVLLGHLATRESYHGTAEWRAERERLKAACRRAAAACRS